MFLTSILNVRLFFFLLQRKLTPGVSSFLIEDYILANPEWKMDRMPEIMDGKNIADFIDPDIAEKLEALEREEEKLQAEGFYESESDMVRFLFI